MTRYYGWCANWTRGMRRRHATEGGERKGRVEASVLITDPVNWSLRSARCRWAQLLRRSFEVDLLTCARCSAPTRIGAVIADPLRPPRADAPPRNGDRYEGSSCP